MKATKRNHLRIIKINAGSYKIKYLKNKKTPLMYRVVIIEKSRIINKPLGKPISEIFLPYISNFNEPTTRC